MYEPYDVITNADSQRQHYNNGCRRTGHRAVPRHHDATAEFHRGDTVFTTTQYTNRIAVYNGTVGDNNGTYAVSVRAYNNTQTAQAQFLSLRTMFMGQGYAAVQQNATAWSGFNATARRGAAVEYGSSPLMPYYGMVLTGGAVGQAPFQQAMWQHMWDDMHERLGNGGGTGPYTGYGMNAHTRS